MANPKSIHSLVAKDGIELIMTVAADGTADVASRIPSPEIQEATATVLSLFGCCPSSDGLRLSVGEVKDADGKVTVPARTIHAMESDGIRVAIVARTNHPIAKSVKRTMVSILRSAQKAAPAETVAASKTVPSKSWF